MPIKKSKSQVRKRASIIAGQAKAIVDMIDNDRSVLDIMIQLAALSSAAKSLYSFIAENEARENFQELILGLLSKVGFKGIGWEKIEKYLDKDTAKQIVDIFVGFAK